MKNRLLFLALVGMFIAVGCMNEPPPTQTAVPRGTGCASLAIACFDEFARQPAKIICFREASRWDRTDLTWRIGSFFDSLDEAGQIDAADRAFQLWADASNLTFTQMTTGSADITIDFVAGEHGDDFPFDGPGDVLGHAFFPGSGNPGQIHLCNQEQWALSAGEGQFDLFTGLVHEIGHALGLEHSLDDDAVMAPNYMEGISELDEDDVEAVQRLYGSPGGEVPPLMNNDAEFAEFCADAGMNLIAQGDPDTDDDGIPDTYERFVLNTDPVGGDTDDDGSNDFTEIFIDRTDPLDIMDFVPTIPDGDLNAEVNVDVFVNGVLQIQYRTNDNRTTVVANDGGGTDDISYVFSLSQLAEVPANSANNMLTVSFADLGDLTGQTRNIQDVEVLITITNDLNGSSTDVIAATWFNICNDSIPVELCDQVTASFAGVTGTTDLAFTNMRVFGSFDVTGPAVNGETIRIVGQIDLPEEIVLGPEFPGGIVPTDPAP